MKTFLFVGACALSLAGCATKRQAEGTAAGAIGGALVAGPVGAVVGGAAGSALTGPGGTLSRSCRFRDRHGRWRRRAC